MTRRRWALVVVALVVVAGLAACADPNPPFDSNDQSPTVTLPPIGAAGGDEVSGTVTIFASLELAAAGTRLATAFERQNPKAKVEFTPENPRESIVRLIAKTDADLFITDHSTMVLFGAYVPTAPDAKYFTRERLVMVVPNGNPNNVTKLSDLGDLPDDAICTPTYMIEQTATDEEQLAVPVNPDSAPDCKKTTVDEVANGDLKGAVVPGTAAGYIRSSKIDRLSLPLNGNLTVPYSYVQFTENQAATGFVNFVASDEGQTILAQSGYG